MSVDFNLLTQLNLSTEKGQKLISDAVSETDILKKLEEYKQRYPDIDISDIISEVQQELVDLYDGKEEKTTREQRKAAREARREARRKRREERKENAEERLQQRLKDAGVEDPQKQRSRIGAEIAILVAKLKSNKPETQKFLITGKLVDGITEEPIHGAEVFLGVNPNPFEDLGNVSTIEDNKSRANAPLSDDELAYLGNITFSNYNNLSESEQNKIAKNFSEKRTKEYTLAITGEEFEIIEGRSGQAKKYQVGEVKISAKQLGNLLKRTEVIKESEGLDLTVDPNNFLYVPVKEFKNPNYNKEEDESPTNLKRITGNTGSDKTKPIITDKNGSFEINVYLPIIPSTNKCTLDVAILTRKSAERDTLGERIPGTGFTPGTFVILNGDRTIKQNLGVKKVVRFSSIGKEIEAEYQRRIDEAQDKINQIALGAAEWVLSQRKVALNKLSNTIKGVLLPLVIGLMLQFGITKLSQANRKTCPTQGELDGIIRNRNKVNRQLNQIYKSVTINTAIAAAFLVLANVLRGVRLSLDALPFPQAIGVPPAKDFGGLIFSQPYSTSAKLQRLNETLEELSENNKELNKAILTNLIFVIAGLATVVILLKAIDGLIQECVEENGETEAELDIINQELLDLAEEGEDDGNPIISNINGFQLSVETDNSNPVGTLKRRFAVAKDTRGTTLLKGEPSFSSSDQILIDELVFYIQQNDLKAF
jgi:hypothetical protein|tara:strand:- start:4339 stop:6465 length:2127 start_codon:yes stop_codon:yes gene_type:complete